eukprot:365604-Chlamydomonas_euryale.AAC.9
MRPALNETTQPATLMATVGSAGLVPDAQISIRSKSASHLGGGGAMGAVGLRLWGTWALGHLPRCSCYNLAPMGARGARGAVYQPQTRCNVRN